MKLRTVALLLLFSTSSLIIAQQTENRNLESFNEVVLWGRVELYLVKSNAPSIKIEMKKKYAMTDFVTKVRNGKLQAYYKKPHKHDTEPKVIVYLYYTELEGLELSGLVTLVSEETIHTESLEIQGDGIVKGDIDVEVKNLRISLDGIGNMTVSGNADCAELRVDGLGKINARKLTANEFEQHADGFAKVRIGSR
ncbi:DUF2807 domain-containing protein [Flavobacteriaceae bacterium TP-CH-4]|uniref:DUF2807 domain-containing protein n=1 Tax=Pelagihabitans pacificus TaxID=2696054 RepID=A0A967AY50_9FLAO|nr:DUF2807 domain-containing protein [Pelagihabitans pacificus]NHF61318.1 DUF2807 domain-containing protein [Pelagihabitans pacificus]